VFLHLLPEIAEGNQAIGEALSDTLEPTPLLDLGIFLVAVAGFAVFYGLERLADAAAPRSAPADRPAAVRTPEQAGGPAATGAPGPTASGGEARREPASVYWLHLGSFVVYNVLITYTMPLRLRTGILFAVLFTVAMGLHFVLTDRGLEEHYPRRFAVSGRFVLAGALVVGWAAGALFAPTSTLLVALLTALLAGSILLNVFKEELPSGGRSSLSWFLVGLIVYSALLALVTALGE
jgi:hypothetical protein